MLSDLAQYFTDSSNSILGLYEDTDLVDFLRFVYQKTLADDIRDGIAADVIGNPDGFYEAFETFGTDIFEGDYHLQDALPHVPPGNNTFLELLLSTVFTREQMELRYEDNSLAVMLEETDKGYRIDSFEGYEEDRKIDRYVNRFISDEMIGMVYEDSPGYIDEYDADMTRVIFGYLKFSSKSQARRVRKIFTKNPWVKDAFKELNIFMKNGCFIILFMYNVESYGSYGPEHIDISTVLYGLTELRKLVSTDSYNQIPRSLAIAFQKLNLNLMDGLESDHMTFASRVIAVLTRKIAPPEGEIIL